MDNYIYSIRTLLFAIGMLMTTMSGPGLAQDARQSVIEQGEQGTIGSVPKSKVDDPPVINRLPPDLTVHNQPLVTRSEAFAGRPLGIGNVSFRLRAGDEMIIRTGSAMIREADGRIFYPVMTKSPVTKFFQTLAGVRPAQPDNVHTIWFLFSGDQPLKLSLLGSGIVEQVIPVKVARERQFDRHLTKWWGEFNDAANRQMEWGDYPALIETYLTLMLSRRLALPPPRKVQKSKDPLSETLDLLFDVESIRTDAIQRSVSGLADNGTADLPLPASIQWTPGSVSNLPADIEIEAIAKCVPEECFYLRFGTWQNQIWLKRLMEEYGGDLGRMVSLRGYKPTIDSKFLDQLAIESSELDQMFGGNLVSDVVVIGTDMYFGEGSSVGVLLRAKNTVSLRNNLMSKRTRFAQKNKDLGVELNEVQHKGTTIHVMATADNRYRSFYATVGDNHLTTTSLTMARRFIEAAGGDRSLGDSDEFKFARYHMPLKRDDTVFVYLSTPFFQSLLEPAYQIELRRRNRIVADMQLYEMARLAARAEGYDPDRMDQLVQNGFLPARFDRRPDQSRFETGQDAWQDNTRGRRGFFTPIPDIKINAVSRDEADWYAARSASFAKNAATIEPLMFAIKRFQSETDKNVERVVFDAHVPPFGMEKYDWLISMIGPPLKQKVKTIPNELISVQVSMVGDQSNPDIEPHLIFVGVQDEIDFPVDLLVPDAHVARLKQDPNFNIVSKLVPGMPQMNYINVTIPPTNDLRVRQAIQHATNKDEINQVVYFGNVEPAHGPLSKANLEFNPEVENLYPFDPEIAKALLEEAGWWDEDGDGIAEAHGVPDVEDGTPLEARIVRGRSWQQYSEVWQRQLSQAGFKTSIIMMASSSGDDWSGCINQLPANGDVYLDSVVGMTRDWSKDQCTGGAMNFGCTCDTEIQPPIDEFLTQAAAAQTIEERQEILGDLQMYIMENALEVPIYELYWHAGIISSLQGVKTDATGFYYYFYDASWDR